MYIDPGTGSMLFSIIIGATAAVFFVMRALVIRLKLFFSGGKKKRAVKNTFVIYAEDKRYWLLFKPILEEFERRCVKVLYITSSKDDPVFDAAFSYIETEWVSAGYKVFARLNFLSADVLLATTPGLDVYQWRRAKSVGHYCHILHAVTDATMYRMFGLDYYDSVLCTGDYQKDGIRALEKLRNLPEKELVTVGCPYLDESAKNIEAGGVTARTGSPPFTVLVSPTWGASSLLMRYGEALLDPLVKTEFAVIIRPHPQSRISEFAALDRLAARYKDRVEWDYAPDNAASLSRADIMISDFSGVIFDYMFLFDKPVVYTGLDIDTRSYDAHFLPDRELWLADALRESGVELEEGRFGEIREVLLNARDSAALKPARERARNAAWQHRGESARLTVDFLLSKVEELENGDVGGGI